MSASILMRRSLMSLVINQVRPRYESAQRQEKIIVKVCILVVAFNCESAGASIDDFQSRVTIAEIIPYNHRNDVHSLRNDVPAVRATINRRHNPCFCPDRECFCFHILFFVVPLRGSDFALIPREVDLPPVADLILASIARLVRLTACLVTPSLSAIFDPVNSRIEFTPANVASEIMREPTRVAADSSVGASVLITA